MSFWPAVAIGAIALEGVSQITQGNAAAGAAKARQEELARESQLQQTAALESQASNLMELQRTMGNIRAITAARGLNPDSPSAMAIQGGVERVADTNAQRSAFNSRQGVSASALAGKAAMMSGNAARTAGFLKGAGSFLQAASVASSAFSGPAKASYDTGTGNWTPGPGGF